MSSPPPWPLTSLRIARASAFLFVLHAHALLADIIVFRNGAVLSNCFARDEGVRYLVWKTFTDVGQQPRIVPRGHVISYTHQRSDQWDVKPPLPDLTVTFIELFPKLPSLHGVIHYDKLGRPRIAGAPALSNIGARAYLHPEEVVANLRFAYEPGQIVSLSAHVKNVGFRPSAPFLYTWLINGKPAARGRHLTSLAEMEETVFGLTLPWRTGFHTVTFAVQHAEPEIAVHNNVATDPLWAAPFTFVVSKGRVDAWHQVRSAAGTFCFEDYYRWHVDLMNTLFAASIYPAAPQGILYRVRLDRIVYADDVDQAVKALVAPDGLRYDQGGWVWTDSPEERRTKRYLQTDRQWRTSTEWSLPHELGHQLGLTDWYALDYAGSSNHVMPDNKELLTHYFRHPVTMMHSHGPQPFSEADAAYLNMTLGKPRGYFGDHYFAIPHTTSLRFLDINGQPLAGARVAIFQRGVVVNTNLPPVTTGPVAWQPVIEDGEFNHPVSSLPVIWGTTDTEGVLPLPNRSAAEVRTLNGFHRRPNPFGNINVVGGRGLFLIQVVRNGEPYPAYFWLSIYDFCVAWFRGASNAYQFTLRTPFGSPDAPPAPLSLTALRTNENSALLSWQAPQIRDRDYWQRITAFRLYRRIGSDGLNIKPWFPVATLRPAARTALIDLRDYPDDNYFFSRTERFGVSSVGENGIESSIVSTVLAP
ncbi:MAG: hypothetical protein N2595_08905 [bacterium]|nr:hypothetical protein [bacterium]